jgi:glycosyltransferase involved in cell wall biosynthesis
MNGPEATCKVTIVCVPRDHFSDAAESLESIFANTDGPFDLVYVDGGSPAPVAGHLAAQAASRGFRLIRTERYLSPNHARNLGAAEVATPYMVFVDNDVVVAPGWLPPLVACAERTGAAIVSPLNFEMKPLHTIVHFAGGKAHVDVVGAERHIVDKIVKKNFPKQSAPTECAEFHCMLVRTDAFRAVGGLDPRLLSTRENLDFCMALREAGYEIWFEPASRITYLPPVKMQLADVPYFALRWSDEWDMASFRHFQKKWRLADDAYFAREYRNLGWRRRNLMMRECLLGWLPSWKMRLVAERLLRPLERRLNRVISRRYAQRHLAEPARGTP